MKSYLEILVPIRYDAHWFEELRCALSHIAVKWQLGYYHITMAFLDNTPERVDLCPMLDKHLKTMNAPTLTFDKLDVFTTRSGTHIIYLTVSVIPKEFLSVTEKIRGEMTALGCRIDTSFNLHVTLGRVGDSIIKLSTLQKLVQSVSLPAFSLTLTNIDHRIYRGRTIYETKLNSQ